MRRRSTARGVGEARAIAVLRRQLDRGVPDGVTLGNGDDAAVLEGSRLPWVWSIDSSAEGAHFDLRWVDLATAAERALHAAASDLAAMAATPVAALCAMTVPSAARESDFKAVARGQRRAARQLECPIIGGNLERGPGWRFVTTVLGQSPRPLSRAGTRPGDELWLLGRVGYAAAGLELLRQGREVDEWPSALQRVARQCLRHWRHPRARIALGVQLRARAHAAIDVSDGLASELRHLAQAGGLEIQLEREALRRLGKPLSRLGQMLGDDPRRWVLYGGEDYALLAAGRAARRPDGAVVVGRACAGRARALLVGDGAPAEQLAGGYDHLLGER